MSFPVSRSSSPDVASEASLPVSSAPAMDVVGIDSGGGLVYRGEAAESLADLDYACFAYLLLYGQMPDVKSLGAFEEHWASPSPRTQVSRAGAGALAELVAATARLNLGAEVPVREQAARLLGSVAALNQTLFAHVAGDEKPESSLISQLTAQLTARARDVPAHQGQAALKRVLVYQTELPSDLATSVARTAAWAEAPVHLCVAAAMATFGGRRESGEAEAVIRMLEELKRREGSAEQLLEAVRAGHMRLAGFGQASSDQDPRGALLKQSAYDLMALLNERDPLFGLAAEVEHVVLEAPYFQERNLYANVHFYSALIYRALGIPEAAFELVGILARLPGWVAHAVDAHLSRD